jgi:hypothetical protein
MPLKPKPILHRALTQIERERRPCPYNGIALCLLTLDPDL